MNIIITPLTGLDLFFHTVGIISVGLIVVAIVSAIVISVIELFGG